MINLFEAIGNKLILELEKVNIKAYVWHIATTGSVYIRFDDSRMCSIRIGNHKGRNKLKYKYNLRNDISKEQWKKDEDVWRFYLPLNMWKSLIPVLVNRHNQIQDWGETKFKYNIPSFKKH